MREKDLEDIISIHRKIRREIRERLGEFHTIWEEKDHYRAFKELVFCLLTPQSKAKTGWSAVEELERCGLLLRGRERDIARHLSGVRFHNNKARYVGLVQRRFVRGNRPDLSEVFSRGEDVRALRDFLVKEIVGYGYKEASHFLRNIGLGREIAILDRHILRSLVDLGVIDDLPRSMSKKTYLEIEERMRDFSAQIRIPLEELDFVFWYKATGEVFK